MGYGKTIQAPPSGADRVAKHMSQRGMVQWIEPSAESVKRRKRLEKDPREWLCHYFPIDYHTWEKPHTIILDRILEAAQTGGRYVEAGERGLGKTVLTRGAVLMLKLTGRQSFPVAVHYEARVLASTFEAWKQMLCFNDRLMEDYREIVAPFVHSNGFHQRMAMTHWGPGHPREGEYTGARITVSRGIIVLPDDMGVFGGGTIGRNIKGVNYRTRDRGTLRPSMYVLDDIQDRETAKSPTRVQTTIEIIDRDIGGGGSSGKRTPMVMMCNCTCKGDVTDHYLHSQQWDAHRTACVEKWPVGWENEQSKCRKLWEEWGRRFAAKEPERTFYRKNKAAMMRGLKLSAPKSIERNAIEECPRGVKPPIDKEHALMMMYYGMGHDAFMSERQQEPPDPIAELEPYTLTPEIILSRVDKTRKQFERPDWVTRVFASSDINPSYAFSTVILGFGEDHTVAVLWWGVHKLDVDVRNMAKAEYAQALYPEIIRHGEAISGLPESCRPEMWALDAGGDQFDAVAPYADRIAKATGLSVMPMTGRYGLKYYAYGKTAVKSQVREHCHGCTDIKGGVRLRWVAWNACYWGEVAQRAWLGADGAPGRLSLYNGKHYDLARQICNKRLVSKEDKGGKTEWKWQNIPGKQDFHDATAQCYALAAFGGIGTGGLVVRRKRYVEKRKTTNTEWKQL